MTDILYYLIKLLGSAIIFIGAYLSDIKEIGLVITIFIGVDFVTGVWASYYQGEKIESWRAKRTVAKFVVYAIALIISLMFSNHFGADLLTPIAFFIASIEVKSIFENLYKVTKVDFVDMMFNILNDKVKQIKEKRKPRNRRKDEKSVDKDS